MWQICGPVEAVAAGNEIKNSASGSDLSTMGWRLWPDEKAAWRDDKLFLPEDTVLNRLPVLPPTGGWAVLTGELGIPVTLPSSVEEHYWGKFRGGPTDGFYQGVSWWWRTFTAPPLQPGQRLIVRFRAAKLRAEVYCNQKLCAYNLIAETPFQADVTDAVHPGPGNHLAVRITSPGGDLTWCDWGDVSWGPSRVPMGKAIGGLDAGIVLEVRDPVSVEELAVLNHPDPRSIDIVSTVRNTGTAAFLGPIDLRITRGGKVIWAGVQKVSVPAGAQADFTQAVTVPTAALWDLQSPTLYTAEAAIPGKNASGRKVDFGFRWFGPEGIGSNALFRLNGKRIVLRSAISWGWWAPNGLFPTDDLARKEVFDAKALGLNCLQFHRNIGHPNLLDIQDQLGLLRYEEPGNGRTALHMGNPSYDPITPPTEKDKTGLGGEPASFQEKYQVEKILRMVRRDRSHPSLILYCLQNEVGPALNNAHIFWLFERIREIDPSRTVYLHSGVPPLNQVAMLPYTPRGAFLTEDGTGKSGWRDQHTVGGPGNVRDSLYTDKDNFSHRSADKKEIVIWGEMLGAGVPDDHEKIVEDYRNAPEGQRAGYDLQVHEEALKAYDGFLDQWGFRSSYPTASALFRAIGTKSYFFWQKVMEGARMNDENDALVISGWESTHVENHSGLVDEHRNLRADPKILEKAMEPEVLVIRPKRFVLQPGETADVDVHLINETGRSGTQSLTLTARDSLGRAIFEDKRDVEVTGGDVYGQVLATGFRFVPASAGPVTLTGTLLPRKGSGSKLTNTAETLVVAPASGTPLPKNVVVIERDGKIAQALTKTFQLAPLDASHLDGPLDAVVLSTGSPWDYRFTGGGRELDQTAFPNLYKRQMHGASGPLGSWSGIAPGPLTIEFYFAEVTFDKAGERVFDLSVNGAPVLTDLDVFKESGGKNRPLVKTVHVTTDDGVVTVANTGVRNQIQIAGLKITDSKGKVMAVSFGSDLLKDKDGLAWQPLDSSTGMVSDAQWATILRRVKDDGVRLVIVPNKTVETMWYLRKLEAAGILHVQSFTDSRGTSEGFLGKGRDSWMGSWYFSRPHWLFDGLPSGSVLGWQFQVSQSADGAGGLLIDAAAGCPMEVVVGYGRDHEAAVGIGACVIRYGKGTIVLSALPGWRDSLVSAGSDITQPVALRLLGNALRPIPVQR